MFPRFWLVKTTRIIHHNQLLFTKFGKNLRHIESMASKVQPAENYWTDDVKMTSKVHPAADYWTVDRENLGTRLCYIWIGERKNKERNGETPLRRREQETRNEQETRTRNGRKVVENNDHIPTPGIEPGPRRWERRILTTRPRGIACLSVACYADAKTRSNLPPSMSSKQTSFWAKYPAVKCMPSPSIIWSRIILKRGTFDCIISSSLQEQHKKLINETPSIACR